MREFQERFYRALLATSAPSDAGMRVHRDNVFGGLTEALGVQFPVIRRLVGESFFAAAAQDFLRDHLPKSPVMIGFGAEFPAFLSRLPSAARLPWLADVARLELLMHEAYHAADIQAVTRNDLSGLPADGLSGLRLTLHPSVRLLSSPYPVDLIWRVNQPGQSLEDTVDLPDRPAYVLVARPDDVVETRGLTEPAFRFVSALASGGTLLTAEQDAGADFDGTSLILDLFDNGLIAAITV